MNFYNPYYVPYTYASRGLFSNLFRGISFSSILNGAGRTLNVINQAIPVVKEISPMIKNTKTMFRVMNEFKKVDTENTYSANNNHNEEATYEYTNGPTFFK
ncbi:MAG: hypothetical protein IJ565_06705 [Bacilli bacterium]|nr:hypothetical protein [Bacilli bacterium]